jgi:hypothetical protein
MLRTLPDALEMGSKKDPPQTLRDEAGYYFGSLQNAQRALKNDPKLRVPDKEKIITLLSPMHRSGDRLGYATVRHDAPALLSAAPSLFPASAACHLFCSGFC